MTKQKKNVTKIPMVNIRKHTVHDWLLRYSCNKVMEILLKYVFTFLAYLLKGYDIA